MYHTAEGHSTAVLTHLHSLGMRMLCDTLLSTHGTDLRSRTGIACALGLPLALIDLDADSFGPAVFVRDCTSNVSPALPFDVEDAN